jgi:hypothetical protein
MKIELIKEEQYGKSPWYEILIDGAFYTGSLLQSKIEKDYEAILANSEIIKIKRELLRSDEIVLPLQEEIKLETEENGESQE